MHHSSLCAGAYLKGHRETRIGGGIGVWGTLESPGEKWGEKRLPFFPPRALFTRPFFKGYIKGRLLGSFSRSAFVNWARYLLQFGSQLVLPETLCQEGCVR